MDIWVVVVITGEDESAKVEKRSQDRPLGGTNTPRGRERKSSPPKQCDTDKIAKKPVSWVNQLSLVPFSRASCIDQQRLKSE